MRSWIVMAGPLPHAFVPIGQHANGQPFGMSIIGREFGEHAILAISKAYQEVRVTPLLVRASETFSQLFARIDLSSSTGSHFS